MPSFEQQHAGVFNPREALQQKRADLEKQISDLSQQSKEAVGADRQALLNKIFDLEGKKFDIDGKLDALTPDTRSEQKAERPSLDMETIRAAQAAGLVKRVESAMQKPTLYPDASQSISSTEESTQKVQFMRAISDADIASYNARRGH